MQLSYPVCVLGFYSVFPASKLEKRGRKKKKKGVYLVIIEIEIIDYIFFIYEMNILDHLCLKRKRSW